MATPFFQEAAGRWTKTAFCWRSIWVPGWCESGPLYDPALPVWWQLLHREKFADDFESFTEHLVEVLDQLANEHGKRLVEARAIGIASPGLFRSDGSYPWRRTRPSWQATI